MTPSTELHDLFAGWLSARQPGAADDPPRDLALHAAGCDRCLRAASAIDTLSAIDVGAAAPPPLRAEPIRWTEGRLVRLARYATATAALVLVAASVAIGSSWLNERRPTDAVEVRSSPAGDILAGVPSPTARARSGTKASTTSSPQPSASAEPSGSTADETEAPFTTPQPTFQQVPPTPTVPTAPPTPPPPTATPEPTPTPTPEPTPTTRRPSRLRPRRPSRTTAPMGSTMTAIRSLTISTPAAS